MAAIIGKAAAAAGKSKAFEHLGKIKEKEWKAMGGAFKEMKDFAKAGGVAQFIGGTISTIKSRIQNQVIGMFSPVINEVTQFTADLLKEAEPLGTALGDFIGLLKDINIQIGNVNVSLLDLILGFPLLLKGLSGLIALFTGPSQLSPEEVANLWSGHVWGGGLVGGHHDPGGGGDVAGGTESTRLPGWAGHTGIQEF